MTVAITSRQAYYEEYARLSGKRFEVFQCIKSWPIPSSGPSIEDIADHLDLRVATVCGRVGELKKAGLVKDESLKRSNTSGKRVKTYIVTTPPEEPTLYTGEQGELFSDQGEAWR